MVETFYTFLSTEHPKHLTPRYKYKSYKTTNHAMAYVYHAEKQCKNKREWVQCSNQVEQSHPPQIQWLAPKCYYCAPIGTRLQNTK